MARNLWKIPDNVVELALAIRHRRGQGQPLVSWHEVAEEVERLGHVRRLPYSPEALASAAAEVLVEKHPLAPLTPEESEQLEQSWRAGWARDFPGEPYPGRLAAQAWLRARAEEATGG